MVEGAQKDRMTFHFGEDDIIRVYDSEKLVDEDELQGGQARGEISAREKEDIKHLIVLR